MEVQKNYEMHETIMKNLHNQRKFGRFCDIRLAVGKQFTWIHSAIMCSISPLINRQCCNALKCPKMKNSKAFSFTSPLTIKLCEKESFECFKCLQLLIDIVYGQKVDVNDVHSAHVFALCKMLSFSDILIRLVDQQLKNEHNNETKEINNSIDISKECQSASLSNNNLDLENVKNVKKKFRVPRINYASLDSKGVSGKMQSCLECQYKCYKPYDLLAHLRNTGHGEDVCSLCFVKFASNQELNMHYNLHDHPKPFFCTFCDVRFQTRTLLSQHLPRHSTETPYTCPLCKKGFKWKHGLNSHLVIHSNEKKHLCDECGFSTTHAKTLRAHKLTHTGELFRCSYPGCTHTSSRKENMKIHLGTHNKDKPFVCEICGHKFTQSKSLKRHALKHSNRGLYNVCPHCPFKALRTDNLKSHVLRQHTEKPLNLELCDTFTENLINTDCNHIKFEQDSHVEECMKNENDLSVLADAASSRSKILDTDVACAVQDTTETCSVSRNFDNLIANPVKVEEKDENIHLIVLCDESGVPLNP